MTVVETSLYSDLHVETSPVAATAVWTDHIATVRDVSLTTGGREVYIGVSSVETGSGTITLVDFGGTINPGYWLRLRYSTGSIVWGGFVQDVLKTTTFINGESYTITTLVVLDWVGWISQYTFDTYPAATNWWDRIVDINTLIDSTRANRPITEPGTGTATAFTFPTYEVEASVAEMLDMLANSVPNAYWKANNVVPSGSTSGIDNIIVFSTTVPAVSANLSDGTHTGTPSNLIHYNFVEMGYQTSAVINNMVTSTTFKKFDQMVTTEYRQRDGTSIDTYGPRSARVNVTAKGTLDTNLVYYPSFEEYDYSATATTFRTSVERPDKSTIPFNARDGVNALRGIVTSTPATIITLTNQERISITAGTTYYVLGYAAVYSITNCQARIRIDWYDDNDAVISTTFGSYVAITSNRTWYPAAASAAAPAGSTRARMAMYHTRTTGASYASSDKLWTDLWYFGSTKPGLPFTGNDNDTSIYLYGWLGTPNASQSFQMYNMLTGIGGTILNDNKTAKYAPFRIRLNAQDNLTAALNLKPYSRVDVWFAGQKWTTFVTGTQHEITMNPDGTTRWMIDLVLRPTVAT